MGVSNRSCSKASSMFPVYNQQDSFEYNYEECSRPTTVFLGVTAGCNLACPYCFVHQSPAKMTLETAIKAVEYVKKNAIEKEEELTIIFFGGEPLLMYDEIVVPIIERYCEDKEVSCGVSFSLTTNGTLLNEDRIDFLSRHHVGLLLSLDGVQEVQDTQRPGKGFSSFEKVLKNLPYLLVRYPDLTMRGTLTKASLPYLYESYQMGRDFGIVNFSFAYNAFEDWSAEDGQMYFDQMNRILEDVYLNAVDMNAPIIRVGSFNTALNNYGNVMYGEAQFNNAMVRCGTGTTTVTVTPDGQFTTCQERLSHPTFIIGNVDEGIDSAKHERYLTWYWDRVNKISCPSCFPITRALCLQSICPSRLEDLDFKPRTSTCEFYKQTTKLASRIWTLTHETILPRVSLAFGMGRKETVE